MATLPPVTDTMLASSPKRPVGGLGEDARHATMHILDVLGVALAGVSTPPAESPSLLQASRRCY